MESHYQAVKSIKHQTHNFLFCATQKWDHAFHHVIRLVFLCCLHPEGFCWSGSIYTVSSSAYPLNLDCYTTPTSSRPLT